MKNSTGFTLVELVVTITLVGILVIATIPTYSNLTSRAQFQINVSNMHVIKDTFMQYYYENHMIGNPHFPQESENALLDSTYRQTALEDGRTPDDLFSGDLPYNTNNNPYIYYTESDTSQTGWISNRIIIKDVDPDSPSINEFVVGEI